MGIRVYKPTSAGRRNASVSDFAELTPGYKPEKSLLRPKRKTGGRNNQGKITSRHRGGGHKQKYRVVDFRRVKDGVHGTVDSVQYDPNRSARIALLKYADGEKAYVVAPAGMKAGDPIQNGPDAPPMLGNCLPLKNIPLGTTVCCIELRAGRGAVLCRSAGTQATLMAREADWAQLSLPSGEVRRVPSACRATIGQVGNSDHMNVRLGKAGRARWLGRRPHVRGTAMNPIDHPHGGGEGRTKGGRHPVSPRARVPRAAEHARNVNQATARLFVAARASVTAS